MVKPCIRRIVTTTDQGTGERDGDEPLHTLKSYRWHAALKGVAFGQNAVVVSGAGKKLEVAWSADRSRYVMPVSHSSGERYAYRKAA
jgi:uncharacterized protein YcbX